MTVLEVKGKKQQKYSGQKPTQIVKAKKQPNPHRAPGKNRTQDARDGRKTHAITQKLKTTCIGQEPNLRHKGWEGKPRNQGRDWKPNLLGASGRNRIQDTRGGTKPYRGIRKREPSLTYRAGIEPWTPRMKGKGRLRSNLVTSLWREVFILSFFLFTLKNREFYATQRSRCHNTMQKN